GNSDSGKVVPESTAAGDVTIKADEGTKKDNSGATSESKTLAEAFASPGNTLPSDSSVSLDVFVTPSETPAQSLSPVLPDASKKSDVPASLPTTLARSVEANDGESKPEDFEPPTPTPHSVGFSKVDAIKATGKSHQRNTSVSSIRSDGSNSRTPRPSTPNNSQASPRTSMIGKPSSSSRPSTPNKSGAPPPVPRRAAARNAAKPNVTPAKQRGSGDKGGDKENSDKMDTPESKPEVEAASTHEPTNKTDINAETPTAAAGEGTSGGTEQPVTALSSSENAA
ncbi:6069_t:CDS:1, partial [Acaulospora colombiana]